MNSFVISVCIFALPLLAVHSHPANIEEMRDSALKLVMECKTKTGASDGDVDALKMHKMPESHEGFCMLECVFDSAKIMQNGRYSKSGMIEAFKPLIGDDAAKQDNIEKLATACETELGDAGEDKCENAKKLVECIVKNGKNQGFEIPPPRQ